MRFGKSVGTACSSFAITNVDDMFILVVFFSEAVTSSTLTPLKVTLGQYIGFTVIIAISMIGFGASLLLPSEPIGFLGLLPILLGIWKLLELLFPSEPGGSETSNIAGMKSVLKVSAVTVMNGGDNIGTYIPLFSQTKGAEIVVYVVIYYILLGLWCLAAFLVLRQRHILSMVEKYVGLVIPFLYTGLGIYIIVKSSCYPWSIQNINNSLLANPGKTIMATITTFLFLICISIMLFFKMRKKSTKIARHPLEPDIALAEDSLPPAESLADIQHTQGKRNDSELGQEEYVVKTAERQVTMTKKNVVE